MKRITSFLLAAVLAFSLCACGKTAPADNGKIKITATVFSAYDFVKEIIGQSDKFEIKLLSDNHIDLHSFQPSADDIISIVDADLFVFVGGASDKWAGSVLENTGKKVNAVDLISLIGSLAKEEETKEGMQSEEEEESELDEHVWLSLKNAQVMVKKLADEICALDGENASVYRKNAEEYEKKLLKLDGEYKAAVSAAPRKTLLFADRFPFRYLTDDYGVDYYAAFSGCSAESEVSPETIAFLSHKLDTENIGSIIVLEGSGDKMAQTVKDSSRKKDAKILRLNSIESVSSKDGLSFIDIMQKNLEVLKEALY